MTADKRIVIATLGSLGDLYPYLALGVGLTNRGHRVSIATNTRHKHRVEAAGLDWRRMRPEPPDDPELSAKIMDPKTGPKFVYRYLLAPTIRDSYTDLHEAVEGADFLISSPIAFAAPLLAEKKGMPWASAILQPMGFFSAYDPPVLPEMQRLSAALHPLGRIFGSPLRAFVQAGTRSWSKPMRALRHDLGLAMPGHDPLWEGKHSSKLILAMFPRILAKPQPDWPRQARVTGALFWNGNPAARAAGPELERFLQAGTPPIVFTLGSAAVNAAGNFYADSLAAVRALNRRAILLIGFEPTNRTQLPAELPEDVLALPFAPHAQIFPRATAIVHQGGAGTLAQAMRAGKPMLVVPFSHDQPDNAARVTRLGIGRALSPKRYTADTAARTLSLLLNDQLVAAAAEAVGRTVRTEDGINCACDLVEDAMMPNRA